MVRLTEGAFSPDLVVDGDGRRDYEIGPTELSVTIEGDLAPMS